MTISVKPGDLVFIQHYGLGAHLEKRKVARVLKKFVELDNGSKWDMHGSPYPRNKYNSYGGPSVVAWTGALDLQYKNENVRRRILALDGRFKTAIKNCEDPIALTTVLTAMKAFIELNEEALSEPKRESQP